MSRYGEVAATKGVARALGEFVAGVDGRAIPTDARTIASRAFADTVSVAMAGTANAIGRRIIDHTDRHAPDGPGDRVDGGRSVALLDALLMNATLAHCLDFDDTNHPLYGHPSSVLVPTAAGVGAETGAIGADAVTAYLIGHEIEVALARAINHDHYAQGFHATGSLGVLAAAGCAARLMGLSAEQAGQAVALAASSSGGIRANIGSMTKPFHAGMAAMNGFRAARLAAEGWESSWDALERPETGFFAAYAVGKKPDLAAALDPLDEAWAIAEPFGQQIKPYPACGATHPATEAAIEAARQVYGDEVESVHVGVCALAPGILVYDDPKTSHEARFSLVYPVARAMVSGRVGLASFTTERIADPDVRSMMAKVSYEIDDRVKDSSEFAAIVQVRTSDGRTIETRSDFALGKNAKPMSEAQLHEKFDGCLQTVGTRSGDEVWDSWRGVDSDRPVTDLWESVRAWWS